MQTIPYLLLSGTIILSGLSFFAFKKNNPHFLKLSLAFSGSYLFAITFLQLLPEVYASNDNKTGIFILAGFMFQIILELFSEGIEHGHIHMHGKDDEHLHHLGAKIPFGVVIGLCLHSFLEGMPLGMVTSDSKIFPPFLMGIVLHNIPIAIAFMGLLLHLGHSKTKAFSLLGMFALMTPFGMLASHFIGMQLQGDLAPYFSAVTGVVIGIFLHISTTILFESTENHRFNALKFVTILLGVAAAWLLIR